MTPDMEALARYLWDRFGHLGTSWEELGEAERRFWRRAATDVLRAAGLEMGDEASRDRCPDCGFKTRTGRHAATCPHGPWGLQ